MYLGIDIGGTKTLVACMDGHGVVRERVKFSTPEVYGDFLQELANTVASLSTKEFVACGIAVPGRVDRKQGIGVAFGNLHWHDIPIERDIKRIAHCPVVVENDANLAGLSEAMLLKNEFQKVLYVTISTGIGTGIIVNQVIDPAFADSEGGQIILEYGGKLERWEHIASGKAIVERFGKQAHEITDEASWRIIAHDLALGIADLVAIIQPEVVVFGGGVDRYFQHFHRFLTEELKKYETPLVPMPVLRKAGRPDDAVVYGCYDLARSKYGRARS